MDWALVLASQAIETTIDYSPETQGWELVVADQDIARAQETIRLYRLENRRWGWRHKIPSTSLLFDWTGILWVLLLGVFFLASGAHPGFRAGGVMDATKVAEGQWWRMFTAIWLHADAAHLAANATLGFVLLGLSMGRYGAGVGLLATYLSGVGGNLVPWTLGAQGASLGASGAVMGSLGLLAAQSFKMKLRTPQQSKRLITGVLGGLMLFVLFGLAPGTDIRAHLAGFLTGLALGALLSLMPSPAANTRLNLASSLLFLGLVIYPWWDAIQHAR